MLSISLLKFSLSSLSTLITILLNFICSKLPPFHLGLFLETSPILSFGVYFFVYSFWLLLCVCFYVLGKSAMTPSFGSMAICIMCLMGWQNELKGTLGMSLVRLHGFCCCDYVLISIVLFVHEVDPQSHWLRTNPYLSVWAALQVLTTWSRICLSMVWCLLRSAFGSATCEANWILLWCFLKLVSGCVCCGIFWEGLCCKSTSDAPRN